MAWADEAQTLARAAASLGRRAARVKRRRRLPTLWFVTDPARTPDPVATAHRLPRGSGMIYRAFGAAQARETGRALAAVARRRGLMLLAGADEALAAAIGADGVHLPERLVARGRRLRARRPAWIVTTAAHGATALARAARLELDAAFLSAVFPSHSASAKSPIGPVRFSRLVRASRLPVVALGGVNARTVGRLLSSRAAGLAAVEGLSPRAD